MPNNKQASQIKESKIKNKDITDVSNIQAYVSFNEVIKDLINKVAKEYKAFYDSKTRTLKMELEDNKKKSGFY